MIKAIETHYNGYRFRSRLEARWAVFLDALNVPYEYEKEGYELDGVGWYLPDFWLPKHGVFFEVKGAMASRDELRKAEVLATATGDIVLFSPHAAFQYGLDNGRSPIGFLVAGVDHVGVYSWSIDQGDVGFAFGSAGPEGITPMGSLFISRNEEHSGNPCHPDIMAAYTAARSARFEYGEGGRS